MLVMFNWKFCFLTFFIEFNFHLDKKNMPAFSKFCARVQSSNWNTFIYILRVSTTTWHCSTKRD